MLGREIAALRESGLSYGRMSRALSVARSTLAARASRFLKAGTTTAHKARKGGSEETLRAWIRAIKKRKPTWGIRRVHAWLRKIGGFAAGRKKTRRLLKEENLLCPRIKKRSTRKTGRRSPATRPNQLWATDMTQFLLTAGQKLFLIVVLDVFLRRIVGYHLSFRCRAKEWLAALNQAVRREFVGGTRGCNLTLRMDNGCQPTSRAYQDALSTLEIAGEWTGYNCPEQNAHVERVIGTLKMDWLWIHECDTFDEAQALVDRAVSEYNREHPHSSLNFLSPDEFRRAYEKGWVSINPDSTIEIAPKAA